MLIVVIDVSEQPIGLVSLEKMGTDRLSRNVGDYQSTLCDIQKEQRPYITDLTVGKYSTRPTAIITTAGIK